MNTMLEFCTRFHGDNVSTKKLSQEYTTTSTIKTLASSNRSSLCQQKCKTTHHNNESKR